MPSVKLTKSVIDELPTPSKETVYWDDGLPGFGVKVTPAGRKVFIALYRMGGAGARVRKYTIGPYGRITLQLARAAAQRVFAAKFDGRDLAAEKQATRRREVVDRVDLLLEQFISDHLRSCDPGPRSSGCCDARSLRNGERRASTILERRCDPDRHRGFERCPASRRKAA